MLTIVKTSAAFRRPKYVPQNRWAQWAVFNTTAKAIVYGPDVRSACERYITVNEKED